MDKGNETEKIGWSFFPLETVIDKISTNGKKIKQKEYIVEGKYPVIDQGADFIGGYTNDDSKVLRCDLPVVVFGDHTKILKLVRFHFVPGADGVKVLLPHKSILPELFVFFVKILLRKIPDKGYARHFQHLEKSEIPIPPLPEQRAIVAKLEQLFSELDNGIACLKKAQEQLKVYRQAVLKQAFEGELTKAWRRENCVDYQKWSKQNIARLGNIVTGNTPSKQNSEYYDSKEYPFYKPTDLDAGLCIVNSFDGLSLSGYIVGRKAPINSILVTCIGATIGKTGLVKREGCFNQQINAIIPFDGYDAKYVYYQAISVDFQMQLKAHAVATTLPILNKGKFSNLEMSVCSHDEQSQIVQEIETRLSVCDNMEATIKESLEKAEALRQSILKKAFEGKLLSEEELQITRKAPDWEPADKLLERIRSEKRTAK